MSTIASSSVVVVNLAKRPDRKSKILEKLASVSVGVNVVIEAVDGYSLSEDDPKIRTIFNNEKFPYKRGEVGCALSHINIWKQMVSNLENDNDHIVVLEDDVVEISSYFNEFHEFVKKNKDEKSATVDIIYLGYHTPWQVTQELFVPSSNSSSLSISSILSDGRNSRNSIGFGRNRGGIFGYILFKRGAKKLLDHVNRHGVHRAIDWVILEVLAETAFEPVVMVGEKEVCKCILTSESVQNIGSHVDSDIQKSDYMFSYDTYFEIYYAKDSWGGDMEYYDDGGRFSLEGLRNHALALKNCVAYNTYGWFKRSVNTDPSSFINLPSTHHYPERLFVKKLVHVYVEGDKEKIAKRLTDELNMRFEFVNEKEHADLVVGKEDEEIKADEAFYRKIIPKNGKNGKNGKNKWKHEIGLCMIVKNEAHCIEKVLNDVAVKYGAGRVTYYSIDDTGSTDNTKEVIKNFFDARGIEGQIIDEPWTNDFGTNRSRALKHFREAPQKTKYAWMIDADDYIVGDFKLPPPETMNHHSYKIKYGSSTTYTPTWIFHSDYEWRFEGVRHEYPCCDNGPPSYDAVCIEGNYHFVSGREGARNKDSNKYLNDAAALEEAVSKDPNNVRHVFYLAQSYMDGGKPEEARKWYKRRVDMGSWDEERYFAQYKVADLSVRLNLSPREVIEDYFKATIILPKRLEAYHGSSFYCRGKKMYSLGYLFAKYGFDNHYPYPENEGGLFVNADINRCMLEDELSVNAFYAGKRGTAKKHYQRLLLLDKEYVRGRDRIVRNLANCNNIGDKHIIAFYTGYQPVYVSSATDVTIRGTELSVREFARALVRTGKFHVLIFSNPSPILGEVEPGIECYESSWVMEPFFRNHINTLVIVRYIHFFIDYDVSTFGFTNVIVWLHDTQFHDAYNGTKIADKGGRLIANVSHLIHGFICLTEFHKNLIVNTYSVLIKNGSKLKIMGNALVDEGKFREVENKNPKRVKGRFIWTSYVERGLERTLKIVKKLVEEEMVVEIEIFAKIDNEMNTILKSVFGGDPLPPWVHVRGVVPHEVIVEELFAADIWFYPTNWTETYCISALEAMRAGCLCVSTPVGSLPEILGNGTRGLLVSFDDVQFAKLLKKVLLEENDTSNLNKIRSQGQAWAREQTWDKRASDF